LGSGGHRAIAAGHDLRLTEMHVGCSLRWLGEAQHPRVYAASAFVAQVTFPQCVARSPHVPTGQVCARRARAASGHYRPGECMEGGSAMLRTVIIVLVIVILVIVLLRLV